MPLELIDTHCHLDAPDFDDDREAVLDRARQAGVSCFICVGAGYGDSSAANAVKLAEKNPDIFASVGIHPNDCATHPDFSLVEDLSTHPRVLAIGETGLDFYRDHSPRAEQEIWFRRHIELAHRVGKPLIIHSRQAGERCLEILMEMEAQKVGGVFHCFAEDRCFAQRLGQIRFLVSIPGNVTYKNATRLREAVEAVPLEQLMLETDAPFLAPQAYRGKRCESAFLVETAKVVAALKKVSVEELAVKTCENARRLFDF